MKHYFNGWMAGLGLIAFGALFSFNGVYFGFREYLFEVEKGMITHGIVTSHKEESDGDSTTYTVFFAYRDAAEHKYTGSYYMSEYDYTRLVDGHEIDVTYLESSPDVYRLLGRERDKGLFALYVGVPLVIIGLILVATGIQRGFRINRLLSKGISTEATILSIEIDKTVEINDRNPQYLVYQYTDSTGQDHRGKSDHLTLDEETYWSRYLRRPLPVYYDPNKPEINHAIVAISANQRAKLVA